MKFQAVIFDMDGLMLDSERVYRQVFTRAAVDCGLHMSQELHDRLVGRNSVDTHAILLEEWKEQSLLDQFLERFRCHHHICFSEPLETKAGLLELLDFLEERRIPKVVATSTKRQVALTRLEHAGLLNRFQSVSTGDEVKYGKPAPDLFLLAAGRIPAEPSLCVVLEDSEPGVRGAHAAGMTPIMVPDMKQPCDDVRKLAAGVFPSLEYVMQFIESKF